MSLGGSLVVLDRAGRDVKRYRLRSGAVTLGSDPACDIRVMLPAVSPHHATVSALYHQTVVRSVSERETLVNGAPVSVAALRHGDVIALGGRALRWEYAAPALRRALAPQPALLRREQRARAPRRGSEPPPRNIIVSEHRASMPASSSGKQVAIVQPQRRDTSDLSDAASTRLPPNKRPRISRNGNTPTNSTESSEPDTEKTKRKSVASPNLANTTKATLWIESRKTSPRKSAVKTQAPPKTPVKTPAVRRNVRKAASAKKSTPLRMVVLKKAQSAQKMKVTKIQAPLKMDSTKQAAIMLMTRHTPKSKQTSPNQGNKGPSFVVTKPSPVKATPKNKRSSGKRSSTTPVDGSRQRQSARISDTRCPSVIEITDSETQSSTRESSITRRSGKSSLQSPHLMSPRKSALKDPNAKRSSRKIESIKFDLSNLDPASHNRSSDVMLVNDTEDNSFTDESETDYTLRYSESPSKSPSPRKPINSRSRRMLESSLGTSATLSPKSDRRTLTLESPRSKKSLRGSIILQEALRINNSDGTEISTYSRRTTKSLSDQSWSTTVASTRQTRTVSPRASRSNLESYSIVDLVSMDSNDSTTTRSGSVYTSADSNHSVTYDTPGSQNLTSISRRAVGCSTPYDQKNQSPPKQRGSSTRSSKRSGISSRSGDSSNLNTSMTTPENTEDATKNITLNSTKISRASKKRFRIFTRQNTLIFMDEDVSDDDSSPKSSKRISKGTQASPLVPKNISDNQSFRNSPPVNDEGMHTPENRHSPVEASTPVLSIQSLLDASQHSNKSPKPAGRRVSKRKTIATLYSESTKGRTGVKSKSLIVRRSGRGKDMVNNLDNSDVSTQNSEEEVVTPKSAAKPQPEGVKNKHSSAKKPLSKRSLIDNLNESDIVKQLFNSPVKRKLSQSMTEFSRRHLFNDDEDRPRRPTRATIAVAGRSPDRSLMDHTESFTPEIFVSPLNTPSNSPNMTGIKRLFQRNTPQNDLRNVRGVKGLLQTPRTRKSIKNDLTNVSGLKAVFAKSPRNRLSDVRVKEVFAASPRNDLRRVSGVKELLRSQRRKRRSPRNELDDLRGVRTLFKNDAPGDDLRNVSGVKRTLQRSSPRNDLSDVTGIKRMFRQEKQRNELSDVSGVERLFHESAEYDSTFDQLLGRPPIRAVYTKSKSFTTASKVQKRPKTTKSKSLHDVDLITNNVEEWLQKELMERLHKKAEARDADTSGSRERKSLNRSRNVSKAMRELQKLNTDTVDGSVPLITSRTRNSSMLNAVQADQSSRKKSASELYGAHTLPIKKRSLVEATTNRSSSDRVQKLPIKKRAVVHSTPVKGRVNVTMNASEIGRMSPIASEDKPAELNIVIKSPQRQVPAKMKSHPKPKPASETPVKEKSTVVVKLSPKRTRSAKAGPSSPAARKTRGRKSNAGNQEVLNIKKRRSSVVITKRAPVLSPKPPSPKVTRRGKSIATKVEVDTKVSSKKTRSTRGQKSQVSVEVKTATPKKNTRARVRRTSLVVAKPSPKLNPRGTRAARGKPANSPPKQLNTKTKQPRNVIVLEPKVEDKSKNATQKKTRVEPQSKKKSRNTADSLLAATFADKSSVTQTRRTRRTAVEPAQSESTNKKSKAQATKTRKATGIKAVAETEPVGKVESFSEVPTRRNRRTKADDTVPEQNTGRRRKTAAKDSAPTSVAKRRPDNQPTEVQPTRSRKAKLETPPDNKTVTEEPPIGRGRKRKISERDTSKTKHAVEKKEAPKKAVSVAKQRNTRGGAGDAAESVPGEKAIARRQAKSGEKPAQTKNAVDVKPARGRKMTSVTESEPRAGGRKRANLEMSDAKDNKKEPTKKARKAAAASPVARATRARNNIATAAASGRARRR